MEGSIGPLELQSIKCLNSIQVHEGATIEALGWSPTLAQTLHSDRLSVTAKLQLGYSFGDLSHTQRHHSLSRWKIFVALKSTFQPLKKRTIFLYPSVRTLFTPGQSWSTKFFNAVARRDVLQRAMCRDSARLICITALLFDFFQLQHRHRPSSSESKTIEGNYPLKFEKIP